MLKSQGRGVWTNYSHRLWAKSQLGLNSNNLLALSPSTRHKKSLHQEKGAPSGQHRNSSLSSLQQKFCTHFQTVLAADVHSGAQAQSYSLCAVVSRNPWSVGESCCWHKHGPAGSLTDSPFAQGSPGCKRVQQLPQ